MDAFYASVEMRDDPSLRGRPVLVGGRGRRSVVAAASYEARRFGCHSAQPMSQALRRCPDAVVVPPRMERYVEVSRHVFEIFARYTPLVEGLSIDEAFLDVTGTERLHGDARAVAQAIRAAVHAELGLTCSVGIAGTKFVAKIASEQDKPDGLMRALWGVGPRAEQTLLRLGLRQVGDLERAGEQRLSEALGERGRHLFALSQGRDPRPVEPNREAAKSIGSEHTVDQDLVGEDALRRALLTQSSRVADRLVHAELAARRVAIKIRDVAFKTESRQLTLPEPTRDARVLHRSACELLTRVQIEGRRFRLIGLSASKLEPHAPRLDDDGLQDVMTSLRDRFGGSALFAAATRDGGDSD
jgi:DNA polymerase-4